MDSEFLSIKEVAVIFSVNAKTIRRAIKKKQLPFIRIGEGHRSPYRISKLVIEAIHQGLLKGLK